MDVGIINNAAQQNAQPVKIRDHIRNTWAELTFDHEDLFLGGARNPLLPHKPGDSYYIYISDKEDLTAMRRYYADVKEGLLEKIRGGALDGISEDDVLDIEVRHLPRDQDGKISLQPHEHGILHIPSRGVSPGLDRYSKGTIYNWDSAFMIRGQIQAGRADLARDMLDNLLYEIDHYNGPLNANSTFCLSINDEGGLDKPRSQLPLVASKVLMLYHNWDLLKNPPEEDKVEWLKRALRSTEDHHGHWTSAPHYDEATGLSKFNTNHIKPGVEVLHAEPEHYRQAYDSLVEMFEHSKASAVPLEKRDYQARKDAYYVTLYLERDEGGNPVPYTADLQTGQITGLTDDFFRGDWAMRESGFDPSRRFGFMNVDISNHLAVCLNCFRKKMEDDVADMYGILAKEEPAVLEWKQGQSKWKEAARDTQAAIQEHLWDDASPQYEGDDPSNAKDPMLAAFRDLNVNPLAEEFNIGRFRRYNFISAAVIPLWTGIAKDEQADHIIRNVLPLYEEENGLRTSTRDDTGCQWDGPISWSPNEIMAAEGSERYGYYHTALRLRVKRLKAIEAEFDRTGALWEKMHSIRGTNQTGDLIGAGVGYAENDRGFGWTIAEYIDGLRSVERLVRKIKGYPLHEANITTNFMVKTEGVASLAKDDDLAPDGLAAYLNRLGFDQLHDEQLKENVAKLLKEDAGSPVLALH